MTIPSKPRTRLFATASADDLPEQVLRGAKNGLPLPAVCLDVSLPPSPVSHCHSHGAVNCVTCQRIDTVPSPSCPVVMYSASCGGDDCVYESCHKLAVKIKPVLKISAHLLLHLLYSHIWLLFSSLPSHSNRRHPFHHPFKNAFPLNCKQERSLLCVSPLLCIKSSAPGLDLNSDPHL